MGRSARHLACPAMMLDGPRWEASQGRAAGHDRKATQIRGGRAVGHTRAQRALPGMNHAIERTSRILFIAVGVTSAGCGARAELDGDTVLAHLAAVGTWMEVAR